MKSEDSVALWCLRQLLQQLSQHPAKLRVDHTGLRFDHPGFGSMVIVFFFSNCDYRQTTISTAGYCLCRWWSVAIPTFHHTVPKLKFLLNSVSSWTFYNCVLFLKEVQRLAEGSETFSPHTAQLYRYLGSQVRNRYAILIIYLVGDYNISLHLNSECIRFFNG